jgi:hypothetical protein
MKRTVRALMSVLALAAGPALASAQSLSYNSGQNVAPAYEGWEEDADGTKYFLFGYMNRNWEEELNVPVGPGNSFSPGPPDQGQPTHFYPRRNRFVFRVKVPANFSDKDELTWTLTTNGETEKAFASLRIDYKVDDVVKASETGALGAGSSSPEVRANKAPVVKVDGAKAITAKVGQPVTLAVVVTDDGIPKTRGEGRAGAAVQNRGTRNQDAIPNSSDAAPRSNRAMLPPARATVGKNVGLHLSWIHYRGPADGKVMFDPVQIKAWEDTRAGANSPWAPIWIAPPMPADGRVPVTATFSAPGTYVIRGVADDGALLGSDDVTVTVTP